MRSALEFLVLSLFANNSRQLIYFIFYHIIKPSRFINKTIDLLANLIREYFIPRLDWGRGSGTRAGFKYSWRNPSIGFQSSMVTCSQNSWRSIATTIPARSALQLFSQMGMATSLPIKDIGGRIFDSFLRYQTWVRSYSRFHPDDFSATINDVGRLDDTFPLFRVSERI